MRTAPALLLVTLVGCAAATEVICYYDSTTQWDYLSSKNTNGIATVQYSGKTVTGSY